METIYKITFSNYDGEDFVELYHHRENAYNRFNAICEENKHRKEYYIEDEDVDDDGYIMCSFFNPSINEYNTYITLIKCTLESLFYD